MIALTKSKDITCIEWNKSDKMPTSLIGGNPIPNGMIGINNDTEQRYRWSKRKGRWLKL